MTAKLRVGVIGANLRGSWGVSAHLPALAALDGFETVAVATAHAESAEATAKAFGVPHAFGDPYALIAHPDVDIVAICVRVPAHRDYVMAAIEAGKHVYCEWPLGRDTAEADAMLRAAEARGIVHAVGLQARSSPVLRHVRDLIAEGAIGTVRSAAITHSADWITQVHPGSAYLQDRSTGAHLLSIPGGHSIDALCWLLGEFDTLWATVKTAVRDLKMVGTGEPVTRTSADQILVGGELENGVVASARISAASSPGTGMRLEISGDDGDLVVSTGTNGRGVQMSDLRLRKTIGMGAFADIEVPEHYYHMPAGARSGPPLNVGELYGAIARRIAGEPVELADFADAAARHRTLDRIEAAAGIAPR